ncbi:MAG: hypothetical protein AMXMBFR58_23030 [Phycisphaerae bacterium]
MKRPILTVSLLLILAGCSASNPGRTASPPEPIQGHRTLGAFSVSLAVRNLAASRAFYEKLGFEPVGGDGTTWQIMRSGTTTIGLFQGMFDRNIMTFNPGWDVNASPLSQFRDIREIQADIKTRGVALTMTADPSSTGPASLMLADPDGNPVLIDQHVPRPAR